MTHASSTLRTPAANPFAGLDVPWLLRTREADCGGHPFLVWEPPGGEGYTLTYADFVTRVRALAAGLSARGVARGDRVLIHLDNCPEFLLAWYACAWLGAVGVTTNTRSARDEVAYFAEHSGVVGAVTQPAYAALVDEAAPQLGWLLCIDHDAGIAASSTPPARAEPFESAFADADAAPSREPDAMAPVGIQYTSGTTSRPKGVVWTHANALWGGRVSAAHEGLTAEDVLLTHLPLFHCNAQSYSVLAALWSGATVVLMARFSASRFWEVSLKHRCTFTSMVPFCIKALLHHPVPERHHYRLWGGPMCDLPTDEQFRVRSIGWWGMTETITHGTVGLLHAPNRPMSMGREAPEYRVAVVRDDGSPVAAGETGHLLVHGIRGVSLFLEYLDNPDATEGSFDESGWFITGDLVTVSADGFLDFADRDKDMLKVGGENVATSEIERVGLLVPGVEEVAVVGRPDDMLDEVPVAFVIPTEDAPENLEETLLEACRSQLADFKLPRAVIRVQELPRVTLGKVDKKKLRAQLREGAA